MKFPSAEEFSERLQIMNARPQRDSSGPWWSARCIHPAHDDDTPSMRFRDGDKALVVTCFACRPSDEGRRTKWINEIFKTVEEATPLADPSPTARTRTGHSGPMDRIAEYVYQDADGTDVARKVRYRTQSGAKTFRFERAIPFGGHSSWSEGLAGKPVHDLPLYRLLDVREADPGATVWIVEGEKDVDRLAQLGEIATCSPDGSHGPPRDFSVLTGRRVVVVPDRDKPGQKSARMWVEALGGVAASIDVRWPVPAHQGADMSDHLDAGHTLDDLITEPVTDESDPCPDSLPFVADGAMKSVPLGRRMVDEMLDKFLWVPSVGWYSWDGCRWRPDPGDAEVRAWTADWAQRHIARLIADPAIQQSEIKEALRYREARGLDDLLRGATTDRRIQHRIQDFDQHPTLLNCPNGVVDLTTGQLRPHDPALGLTKVTAAEYHLEAAHADWSKALDALPDPKDREFLQTRLGQALYGEPTPTDEMVFIHGGGENGKTLIMGTVRKVLGDYAVLLPHSILDARSREHPTELMQLRGARLAVMEELPDGYHLDAVKLKKIVGSESIIARLMYQDFVTFPETHTLFLNTNHLPLINDTDHGLWRRIQRLDFPLRFVKRSQDVARDTDRVGDPRLKRRLLTGQAQQSAALGWMVSAAVAYHQRGRVLPAPPHSIRAATSEWARNANPLLSWIDEHMMFDPEAVVSTAEVLRHFNEHNEGGRDWTAKLFSERFMSAPGVADHGVMKARSRRTTHLSNGTAIECLHKNPQQCWFGIRWRMAGDPDQCLCQMCQKKTKPTEIASSGEVVCSSDTPDTPLDYDAGWRPNAAVVHPVLPSPKTPTPRVTRPRRLPAGLYDSLVQVTCEGCSKPSIISPCSTCRPQFQPRAGRE